MTEIAQECAQIGWPEAVMEIGMFFSMAIAVIGVNWAISRQTLTKE